MSKGIVVRTLLAIDVGGTNTRARAAALDDLGEMHEHPGMPEARVEKIASAEQLAGFVAGLAELLEDITAAVIAVAGPVSGTSARMTNWEGTPGLTLAELTRLGLPNGSTRLFNDVVAGAHGVLAHISTQPFEAFTALGGPEGTPVLGQGHLVYVAPGTGLGAATLVRCSGARYHAVGCESQHTPAHAPAGREELHRELEGFLGHSPSWEDVVSGAGLALLDRICAGQPASQLALDPPVARSAGDVGARAADGDPAARQAVETFYDYLAGFCQMLALGSTPCEAVIVGGATTRQNLPVFVMSEFARRFADNPVHSGLLGRTRLRAIAEDTNLDGCLRLAAMETAD